MQNHKTMKIALVCNIKRKPKRGESEDKYAEFDDLSTVRAIKNALSGIKGRAVKIIEADKNAYEKIKRFKPDIAFNIAEGFHGESREAQIPAMLEMLEIPYTGSGPTTLAITLNKALTKKILTYHGILTPRFQVFSSGNEPIDKRLKFPLIVKLIAEGSSKGLRNNSLVKNEKELIKKVKEVISEYNERVVAEEYLAGIEFTVAMLGNYGKKQTPTILPIIEVTFKHLPKGLNKFDSYESKWIYDSPDAKIDPLICPAKISKSLEKKIKETCLKTFLALNCDDWCRIDLRLDRKGIPNVLEINALPGIIPDPKENSRFPRAARTAKIPYDKMVNLVLDAAMKRHKLNEANRNAK